MSRIIDNTLALKVLHMLVTPFTDTDAFKMGLIDATGRTLRKATTSEEKDAHNYLHRLVFNMKKIINKIGGESKIKNYAAALWLVKEHYKSNTRSTTIMEEKFAQLLKMLDNRVSLVEEEIAVKNFLHEDGVANVTGAAVSTNEPKIGAKDIKKYKAGQGMTIAGMVRRPKPVEEK